MERFSAWRQAPPFDTLGLHKERKPLCRLRFFLKTPAKVGGCRTGARHTPCAIPLRDPPPKPPQRGPSGGYYPPACRAPSTVGRDFDPAEKPPLLGEGDRVSGGRVGTVSLLLYYPHLFLRKETVVTARESGDRPLAFAPANDYLAVPKNFYGIRLEIFDRGAVPCSLLPPLAALRRLRSSGGDSRQIRAK